MSLPKTKKDLLDVYESFSKIFDIMGDFVTKFGNFEKEHKREFEEFQRITKDPNIFMEMIKNEDSEKLGKFFKIVFTLSQITPKLNNLINLNYKEKIELGAQLKELSKKLEELKK